MRACKGAVYAQSYQEVSRPLVAPLASRDRPRIPKLKPLRPNAGNGKVTDSEVRELTLSNLAEYVGWSRQILRRADQEEGSRDAVKHDTTVRSLCTAPAVRWGHRG
jgi:hypothetical protein